MVAKREKARHAGGLNLSNFVIVAASLLVGFWIATQWVAALLAHQKELGNPMFVVGGYRIYQPFAYLGWLINYSGYAPDEFNITMLPIVVSCLIGFLIIVSLSVWRSRLVDEAITYGSARWASIEEIRKSDLISQKMGVVLGKTETGEYLIHSGLEHVKVIAPSRSGKGVGVVIPTLLNWHHSVVVNDIKRELWKETSGWRGKFSHCIAFDPSSTFTAHFNPLLEVRKGIHEIKDVQNITNMIVDPEGKGKPDYWTKEADAYLVALILHVLYAEPNKTLEGVYYFMNNPERSIDDTLEVMLKTEHYGEGKGGHPIVRLGAAGMTNKAPNERSGVQSSAKSFLSLYVDPIVSNATKYSDFRIEDIQKGEYPISLYLISPPSDKDRLKPLFRLILNQITNRLTEEHNSTTNKFRLLLVMDEFPSLGKLPFFEESLGFSAGYGIKVLLISQNYNQLSRIYGNNNSIVDSCHVRVYFAPNTEDSATNISKALGTKTEIHQQRNYAGSRLSPWLNHVMVSNQETSRALMTPNEVMSLPRDEEIILVTGMQPIIAKKIKYYTDKNFIPQTKANIPSLNIPDSMQTTYPYRCKAVGNQWLDLPPVKIYEKTPAVGGSEKQEILAKPVKPKKPRKKKVKKSSDEEIEGNPETAETTTEPTEENKDSNQSVSRGFPVAEKEKVEKQNQLMRNLDMDMNLDAGKD